MKNYYSDPVIERLASTDSDPTRRLTQLPGTNDPEPVTWTQQPRPSDLEVTTTKTWPSKLIPQLLPSVQSERLQFVHPSEEILD